MFWTQSRIGVAIGAAQSKQALGLALADAGEGLSQASSDIHFSERLNRGCAGVDQARMRRASNSTGCSIVLPTGDVLTTCSCSACSAASSASLSTRAVASRRS